MSFLVSGADTVLALLRAVLGVAAMLVALVCVIDWAVRTRRISPFNSIARFFRSSVDPLIAPIERRVVRAGGTPASAPLWALATVVIGGFLVLTFLEFLRAQLATMIFLAGSGPMGIFRLIVKAMFSILRIAIIVSVISSWLPVSPFSRWVRWAHRLSEPLLRPLRQFIPSLGAFDLSPLIAYILLGVIESAVLM